MACACGPAGVDEIFSDKLARRELRRYRKSGLPPRARQLLEALETSAGIPGHDVLEIGAGIGDLSLELLERGATRALLVDAAPAFVEAARKLASERGVTDRVEVVQGDFAALGGIQPRDLVVLDRVVCCYPDGPALLAAAAAATRTALTLSYPRDAWWSRLFVRATNFGQRLMRRSFRVFIHPPAALHATLRAAGLDPREAGRQGPWVLVVAPRLNGDV